MTSNDHKNLSHLFMGFSTDLVTMTMTIFKICVFSSALNQVFPF